jgi:hypothetical protein
MWIEKDSLRVRVLARLRDFGPSSITGLAHGLLYPIASVRDKLDTARRAGHVTLEMKPMIYPSGQQILIHQYTITEDGKKWLLLAEQ